jgi:hypothetical protein
MQYDKRASLSKIDEGQSNERPFFRELASRKLARDMGKKAASVIGAASLAFSFSVMVSGDAAPLLREQVVVSAGETPSAESTPDSTEPSTSAETTPLPSLTPEATPSFEYNTQPSPVTDFTWIIGDRTVESTGIEYIGLNANGDLGAPVGAKSFGVYQNANGNWPQPGSGKGRVLADGHTYTNSDEGLFPAAAPDSADVGQEIAITLEDGQAIKYKITDVYKWVTVADYPGVVTENDLMGLGEETREAPESLFFTTCSNGGDTRLIIVAERVA